MAVEVFCDGSSRGQGVTPGVLGEGAVGVVIYKNGKFVGQYARGIGKATNNESEFEAILTALLLCWTNPELADPIIYTDSQVAAKHINGEWQCINATLRPLLLSIQEIQEVFRFRIVHVARHEVQEADRLAKMFLDKLQLALDNDRKQRRTVRQHRRRIRRLQE